MKHLRLLILCALACCALPVTAQYINLDFGKEFKPLLAKTNDPENPLHYDRLVARFKAADPTFNYYEAFVLMIGFIDNYNYNPSSNGIFLRRVARLNATGAHRAAVAACDSLLAWYPMSVAALSEKVHALEALGMPDSAKRSAWQLDLLLEAMAHSGTGRSMASPIVALCWMDAEVYVQRRLQAQLGEVTYHPNAYKKEVIRAELVADKPTGREVLRYLYIYKDHFPYWN